VAVAVLAGRGEDVGAAVMELVKVERKSAESRIRFLIVEISPDMEKRLVEKDPTPGNRK
jgi:hypothetical protein